MDDFEDTREATDYFVTKEARENIRRLASRATKGPWVLWDDGDVGTAYPVEKQRRRRGAPSESFTVESDHIANASQEDGAYVAAVDPTVVIQLLNHIEELEKRLGI